MSIDLETKFNLNSTVFCKSNKGNIVKRGNIEYTTLAIYPDYAAYLSWLAEGNTPEPADPAPEEAFQRQSKTS